MLERINESEGEIEEWRWTPRVSGGVGSFIGDEEQRRASWLGRATNGIP
jgi:hypothetical protein